MFEARVGVKEPHPLQRHWVLPRLKMARSRQGRQRLKTVLRFHKVRAMTPPLSVKIRSRCWSRHIFGVTAVGFVVVSTIRSFSSAANMAPACYESELVQGLSIPASSSLPSLVPLFVSASSPGPPWCFYFFFCFFFSSISRAILVFLLEQSFIGFISCIFFFLLPQLVFGIGLLNPLIVHCTISLS